MYCAVLEIFDLGFSKFEFLRISIFLEILNLGSSLEIFSHFLLDQDFEKQAVHLWAISKNVIFR